MSLIYEGATGDANASASWAESSSGVGGLQFDSGDSDDDDYNNDGGPPRGAIIGMALSSFLLAVWLLCVFYGTKCCTDCHARNSASSIEQRQRRAQAEAQALRENSNRQILTPEQVDIMLQERARQAEKRRAFVKKELKSYPFHKKLSALPTQQLPQHQDGTAEESLDAETNNNNNNNDSPVSKDQCTICMTDFVPGELLSSSGTGRCAHEFHSECLLGWLVHKQSCPICREIMLVKDSCKKKDLQKEEEYNNNSTTQNDEEAQEPSSSSMPRNNNDDDDKYTEMFPTREDNEAIMPNTTTAVLEQEDQQQQQQQHFEEGKTLGLCPP